MRMSDFMRPLLRPPRSALNYTLFSRRGADEAGGVVDAARSFIFRHLRVRTQRTRPIHLPVGAVRRENLVRRGPFLDPLLERGHRFENVRAIARSAVSHP